MTNQTRVALDLSMAAMMLSGSFISALTTLIESPVGIAEFE